jgi:hypothetical protein
MPITVPCAKVVRNLQQASGAEVWANLLRPIEQSLYAERFHTAWVSGDFSLLSARCPLCPR